MLIITLQAKGGVGKSFVTSALTQFCHSIGQPVALFDADPNNATLLATPALGAEPLDLLGAGEGMAIDEAAFDGLMERMTTEPADKVLLVDAGATTFLPLFNYVVSHAIWELCTEYQHPLVLHPVITGGPDCEESVLGFATLASQVECPFLITTNPYHGPVSIQGRLIDEHPAYQEHSGSVLARVDLPAYPSPLFARDVRELLAHHMTFAEAIENKNTALMTRQRLRQVYTALMATFAQALDSFFPPPQSEPPAKPSKRTRASKGS